MESTAVGSLPLELLLDILLRLQVKFLCRCKCVSKRWCSLIESPSFVKEHSEQEWNRESLLLRIWEGNLELPDANGEPNQNGEEVHEEQPNQGVGFHDHDLLIQDIIEDEEYHRQQALKYDGDYKCTFYVDETLSVYETPSHLQMPYEVTDLFGPLNGVFCVVTQNGRGPMALLNPALRQFKPLPSIQQYHPKNMGFLDATIGLGFDPLTGDYKLVTLQRLRDLRSEKRHYFAYVCTSESDSWTFLEDVDPIIAGRHVSMSFGVTYLSELYSYFWLLGSIYNTGAAILAFDMRTEKFRKFLVPSYVAQSYLQYLGLCEDSLALVACDANGKFIDVWRMANEGSWTRQSRVGPFVGFTWPLCFWKSDELLCETDIVDETLTRFVILFNTSTQKSRIIASQNANHSVSSHWAFVYKESLVSIKGEAGKCKVWDPSSDFIKNFFKY